VGTGVVYEPFSSGGQPKLGVGSSISAGLENDRHERPNIFRTIVFDILSLRKSLEEVAARKGSVNLCL
jgi:hypothetical protein